MTFPCHIDENVQEYYFDSFEALNELSTYMASSECSESTFGDIESVIHEKGPEILRQLAQGHLNQRAAEEEKKEFITGEDGVRRTRRRKDCTRKIE